jgi:hypothetical protein
VVRAESLKEAGDLVGRKGVGFRAQAAIIIIIFQGIVVVLGMRRAFWSWSPLAFFGAGGCRRRHD